MPFPQTFGMFIGYYFLIVPLSYFLATLRAFGA